MRSCTAVVRSFDVLISAVTLLGQTVGDRVPIATTISAPSDPAFRDGERRHPREHTSFASRRPIPAINRWSRRNPWMRWFLVRRTGRTSECRWSPAASGPEARRAGEWRASRRRRHPHTPARRSLPSSVSSSAGPSPSNTKRACPPRASQTVFASGHEAPALHQVHDEVHGLELDEVLAARPTAASGAP